ncbi:interferon alpha/beta receptor 2-like [Perca fluviatilis]|uniref:interferon alpha/beta receptor 2-like n=1 Tax=Perca fluviatilis TaxID=8168 RepID=UPI0019657290|nr:interferon alpha/beta receptor 2-like [Perca fluviatilis]
MNCLPLVLYLLLLLDSVLGSLLAPVNLSINSLNFHHVLRWDPGPGTPPGASYKIIRRVNQKDVYMPTNRTLKIRSFKIRLPEYNVDYVLTVRAYYNQSESPDSRKLFFNPSRHTKIGPPKVSLTGCGNCIQINISLPKAEHGSRIKNQDMKPLLNPVYEVFWRKPKGALKSIETTASLYNLTNLQIGTEYCVLVHPKSNVNKNTSPSAWNCTFTSIVEPRDLFVLGAVSGSLILAVGVLMSSMFCLHYTGFLCKLNALPRVLHDALSHGYTLTPERTIPDNISISAGVEKQRKLNNPRTPQPATRGSNLEEEDEEEKEEEEHVYMDRAVELSSGESSCQNSVDVSGNSKVAASGGSGSLTVETEVPDTEFEVEVTRGRLDRDEDKAEGVEVSLMPEVHVTVEVHEPEDKEEVCESSGNINLFSVTLAALAVCEEGEEEEEEQNTRDSLADFLSDIEPLLPADSKWTLGHRDSQTESDDQTTQEDFTATGSEGRHAHIFSCDGEHQETQEEEEEEAYSTSFIKTQLFNHTTISSSLMV